MRVYFDKWLSLAKAAIISHKVHSTQVFIPASCWPRRLRRVCYCTGTVSIHNPCQLYK